MRHIHPTARLLVALAMLPLLLAAAPVADHAVQAAAIARAGRAASQLQGTLQGELAAATKAGGPVAAIEVCRTRALAIAAEVSAATGVQVGRTALRWRNSTNRPTGWEKRTLKQFAARQAAGELLAGMSATRIHRGQLEWLKPIPMGQMCLACHGGAEVAPETAAAIAAAYPKDKARGFATGDLRGAFRARVPLDQPAG
jgi:hypothetical protein